MSGVETLRANLSVFQEASKTSLPSFRSSRTRSPECLFGSLDGGLGMAAGAGISKSAFASKGPSARASNKKHFARRTLFDLRNR